MATEPHHRRPRSPHHRCCNQVPGFGGGNGRSLEVGAGEQREVINITDHIATRYGPKLYMKRVDFIS